MSPVNPPPARPGFLTRKLSAQWLIPGGKRGSILILVLGLIFFMSLGMFVLLREAQDLLVKQSLPRHQQVLREIAYQGGEVALAVLAEFQQMDGRLIHPSQGWGNPLEVTDWRPGGGVEIEMEIRDLSGRMPLTVLLEDPLWWEIFFAEWDIPFSFWTGLRDSLLDWMDADDEMRPAGAEADLYRMRIPPYIPPNAPIRDWEALRFIQVAEDVFYDPTGQPTGYKNQIREDISLHHEGRLNINSASDRLILVLARRGNQDGPGLLRRMAGLDGIRGTVEDLWIAEASQLNWPSGLTDLLQFEATRFQIRVLTRRGATVFTLVLEYQIGNAANGQTGFEAVSAFENGIPVSF